MRANMNTQEKRIEFKESAFKEQMKKITEKYHQSEEERQKVTVNLNNLLSEMEQN